MLKKLVDYASEQAQTLGKIIHYSLPTNCTALSEDALDFIESRNIRLSLSIDGTPPSQSLRKTVSGESSYPKVRDNLDLLYKRGLSHLAGVRKTVTPDSVMNLNKDILFFLDHGLRRITFSPTMETRWPERRLQSFEEQQMKIAGHWIKCLLADEPFSITLWDDMLIRRYSSTEPYCGAGVSQLAVDIGGRLFPCHRFVYYDDLNHTQCLGDVYSGIREETPYRLYNGITRDLMMSRTEDCTSCPHSHSCRLFCPAVNYRLTGDVMKNEPWLCRFEMICERIVAYIADTMKENPRFTDYLERRQNERKEYRIRKQQIDRITNKAHSTLAGLSGKTTG